MKWCRANKHICQFVKRAVLVKNEVDRLNDRKIKKLIQIHKRLLEK